MTRQLQIFLIATICLVTVDGLHCQITGNLNAKDPKALTIDEEVVKKLISKKWLGLKMIETRREETREIDYGRTIEFPAGGEYKNYGGSLNGT